MPNRLADESSPYLLQHQHNPVDWRPWNAEALAASKESGKAIFLSVGYSACHWCHVMEHESFEDPTIAAFLNEHFICIKVDREERPDLDQIYMGAVQLLTGRGGWPMSVFLTPDLHPFFGGTYWPPSARGGLPGFMQVLEAVLEAWNDRREQAVEQSQRLTQAIADLGRPKAEWCPLSIGMLEKAARSLERNFDAHNGGFGGYPKFPHPMDLRLLMHYAARDPNPVWAEMARLTLDKMAAGGIYDHLGGGFHRYSVDARWLVPHFEKMLYDNALLAGVYAEAHQLSGSPDYARTARETCDYVLSEMTDPAGGFYSTEDADSEGEEGKFYVWTPAELAEVLGAEAAALFAKVYDVTPAGNFEGANILNLRRPLAVQAKLLGRSEDDLRAELAAAKEKLFAARKKRIAPGKDDKIIASWNALMIEALALCGSILEEPRYLEAARAAVRFVDAELTLPDGRLRHCWRHGKAKFDGYLDDYSYLVQALVSLYEADFDPQWIGRAVRLADLVLSDFHDPQEGGFYYTAEGDAQLVTRLKEAQDGSVPSSGAMAATALFRLGKLTGRADYLAAAEGALKRQAPHLRDFPGANAQMLLALDAWLGPYPEIVLAGGADDAARTAWRKAVRSVYIPNRLLAETPPAGAASPGAEHLAGLFAGKPGLEGPVKLFVCENFQCSAPEADLAKAVERLKTFAPLPEALASGE